MISYLIDKGNSRAVSIPLSVGHPPRKGGVAMVVTDYIWFAFEVMIIAIIFKALFKRK